MHLAERVFLAELVELCNFLLVRLDLRNLDKAARAEDEHLAFGFEFCELVQRLVVADVSCGDRLDKFRVMAEGELD